MDKNSVNSGKTEKNLVDLKEMEKKPFKTTQSDLLKYNGQSFEILRELEAGREIDFEVAPMFKVRFNDGYETDAFSDEIFTDDSLKKIFTEDFIKKYR